VTVRLSGSIDCQGTWSIRLVRRVETCIDLQSTGRSKETTRRQRKRWQRSRNGLDRSGTDGSSTAPTVMSSRKAEKACECRGEEFISWRSCRGRRHVPRRSSRGPGRPAPEEKAPGSRLCPPGCRIWACGIWASAILLTACVSPQSSDYSASFSCSLRHATGSGRVHPRARSCETHAIVSRAAWVGS
jgi:hypothetical protein